VVLVSLAARACINWTVSPAGLAPRLCRGRFTPAALPLMTSPSAAPAAREEQPTASMDACVPSAPDCLSSAAGTAPPNSATATSYQTCTSGGSAYVTPLTADTVMGGQAQVISQAIRWLCAHGMSCSRLLPSSQRTPMIAEGLKDAHPADVLTCRASCPAALATGAPPFTDPPVSVSPGHAVGQRAAFGAEQHQASAVRRPCSQRPHAEGIVSGQCG